MKNLRYFNLWAFELSGRFYERLGIRLFKRFATAGDYWNKRKKRINPNFKNIKNYDEAIAWEARTRFNELVHLCNLIFSLIMIGWLYLQSRLMWLVPIFVLTIILNLYPILLQRYNRARIWRIKSLLSR